MRAVWISLLISIFCLAACTEEPEDSIAAPAAMSDFERSVRGYLMAQSHSEMMRHCDLGYLSESYFREFESTDDRRVDEIESLIITDDYASVTLRFKDGQSSKAGYYNSDRVPGLIDYPRSFGIPEMTLDQFELLKPTEPRQFWGLVQLSNYYNYGFRGREEEFIALDIDEVRSGSFTGYIRRDSQGIEELISKLNEAKPMTIVLQYPHGIESREQLLVTNWAWGYKVNLSTKADALHFGE